jgi:hypothetical protein
VNEIFKRSWEFMITGKTRSKPKYAFESISDLAGFTFKPIALDQAKMRFKYRPRHAVQNAAILNHNFARLFFRARDRGRLDKGRTETRYLAGRLQPAHQCVNIEAIKYSPKKAPVANAKMSDLSLRRGLKPRTDSRRGGE